MDASLISFLCYLVFLVIVGILTVKFTRTIEGFILGERRLGTFVLALSEKATDFSAWLVVGVPAATYKNGLGMVFAVIGCLAGSLFNWVAIAKRLRQLSGKFNVLTIPSYLSSRFDDKYLLRITAAIFIVFFFTVYISAQCVGAGRVLYVIFGGAPQVWMPIGIGFIVFYTMLGGFAAISWTDCFQALIMVGALVLIPITAIFSAGGFGGFFGNISQVNVDALSLTAGKEGIALWVGIIAANLAIGLGYMGQPHILARYMALRSEKVVPKATAIAMTWTVFALTGALFIGLAGISLLKDIEDPDFVTMELAKHLLPAWLVGIILAAAIAAMMSTADSQLLVVTSAVTDDIYRRLIDPQVSQKRIVSASRILTILVAGIALNLALYAKEGVFTLVLYAWGGLASVFGPAVVLSLLWKRTTKWGVFSGMIIGGVAVIVCATLIKIYDVAALKHTEIIVGFFLSLFTIIFVSLFTRPPKFERGEL